MATPPDHPRAGQAGAGQPPGNQRPGAARPGAPRPGGQQPGAPRPGAPRPGNQRPGNQRPAPARPGGQRPGDPKRASPVLQQRALAALLLGLIALIGMVMLTDNLRRMVVVLAVAFAIGVTGLWLAITAMSRSKREKSNRPRFSVLATVISVGVTGMTGIALIGFALFWTQFSQYAKCDAGANTVATRHACDQQLNNSLNANLRLFGSR